MSKVLYVSSEAFPLVKTGGLADVAGSLPVALLKRGQDARLLLPAYPGVLKNIKRRKTVSKSTYYNLEVEIIETRLPGSNVLVWLVDCPLLFDRPGGPYVDSQGYEWHDNALRFAAFSRAGVDIALNRLELNWKPDIVHCNDWQTGLIPALLSLQSARPATVFTIHNLAYQGVFDEQTFRTLQLPDELWHMEGLEYYGQFSFIKGGLVYADKITTVSPTYAREILQPEFGYGLEGLLAARADDLSGILNGIDDKLWNPGTDPHLVQKYNRRSLSKKINNKTALQEELSLPVDSNLPMLGMIGRLVAQKGLDIILQSLQKIAAKPLQLVILGTGDAHYERQLTTWAENHTNNFKVILGYDESFAHRIEAASDIYLMPSTFEPCGLNQLYSLRYGTLPVVTDVGGLADTVHHASEDNINSGTANGFVLTEQTSSALLTVLDYALDCYNKPELWRQLQQNAMSGDFSWQSSAENYIALYQQVLAEQEALQ